MIRLIILLVSFHVACAGDPYAIPAHWVEGSDVLEPRVVNFQFTDLSFSSPTQGWIVGEAFFLRVSGMELQLTFVEDSPLFWTVAAPSVSEAWAGGSTHRGGEQQTVLWHYADGSWRPVDLSALDLRYTDIAKLRFESPTRGWALLSHLPPRAEQKSSRIPSSSFLHFDGTTWSKVSAGTGTPAPKLNDMCVDASGSGWAVGGVPGPQPRSWRGVVLKKEGLTWREMEPPPVAGTAWDLYQVVCLDGGGMMSSGVAVPPEGTDHRRAFLLSYDGSWHRVPLPEPFENYSPEAMTAASSNEIWVWASGSGDRDPIFLRFTNGQWSNVPFPALPRISNFPLPAIPTWMGGVQVAAMQFVSPTEAWAVGTKHHGGGEWRGLVLHYEDGAWRNRNWNWHFWRERWFGLLGP